MASMTNQSALSLILPESLSPPVQAIRAVHDKVFYRWPPHINLLYPFYTDDDETFAQCATKISQLLQTTKQKDIEIALTPDSFDNLPHKNSCTMILSPEPAAEILDLQSRLQRLFPETFDGQHEKYVPHLSLGHFGSIAEAQAFGDKFSDQWRTSGTKIGWTIGELCLISRKNNDDPFRVKKTVFFDGRIL